MKLSDYVIDFFVQKGTTKFFVMTGGAAAHLIDSVGKRDDCEYICFAHEQAAAMACDAYTRTLYKPGVCIATSGPGATNLFTGIACSYYDSVPTFHITGQVSTFRNSKHTNTRQLGFQETKTVEMAQHITKYAVYIEKAEDIRYELEKAWHIAHEGRRGPVLIDIPDNLQRVEIDPGNLRSYVPLRLDRSTQDDILWQVLEPLQRAARPVLVLGAGVTGTAFRRVFAQALVDKLEIPTLCSWATMDLLPDDHPYKVGNFGTHGSRYGNFTIQNADFILSIGCRLDTHATGSPMNTFARAATKIVVDNDINELGKFAHGGLDDFIPIHMDALTFMESLFNKVNELPRNVQWWAKIKEWKERYALLNEFEDTQYVNPYKLMAKISDLAKEGDIVIVDSSSCLPQTFHGWKVKKGQRLISSFNNSPMGYALPAAIGPASEGKRAIAIMGDGAAQVNIQELATIADHGYDIKIIVLQNWGYNMIKETQNQWLNSRYHGADVDFGVPSPCFRNIAEAYEIDQTEIPTNDHLDKIDFTSTKPHLFEIFLDPHKTEFPITLFGKPIEDLSPYISPEQLKQEMIIPCL